MDTKCFYISTSSTTFDPVLTGLALKSWRTNAETLRAVTFAAAQGADFLMATPQFDAENAGWTCGKMLGTMKFGLRNWKKLWNYGVTMVLDDRNEELTVETMIFCLNMRFCPDHELYPTFYIGLKMGFQRVPFKSGCIFLQGWWNKKVICDHRS